VGAAAVEEEEEEREEVVGVVAEIRTTMNTNFTAKTSFRPPQFIPMIPNY
jgi:hypothetical protein